MYRFGIFCSNENNSLSTNNTTRLNSLSFQKVEEKLKKNIEGLFGLLDLSVQNDYKLFRLGNSFVPFLSHENFSSDWLNKIEYLLDQTKERLKDYNIRITMHPSQFIVLNSPKQNVIDNSLRELKMQFWLCQKLGIKDDGVILIHTGGEYGNKDSAIQRLINTVNKNDWLKQRLAIENDDRIYNANEVLGICKELSIPMVFDIYHHTLNMSDFNKDEFLSTYKIGTPKIHLSSKGDGKFGNHAKFIEYQDFQNICELFGNDVKKIDIMVEAKAKELAVERLKKDILNFE
jgi:UV DNA damage endonuclease